MNLELIIGVGTAALSSIVGPISVNIFNKWLEKKAKTNNENVDHLKEAIDVSMLVTGKLEEIKTKIGADRAFLCQFHNGGHFYPTGQSIQKFSMVYEILSSGISSQQQQFQNIPIGLFNKFINVLAGGDIIPIEDFNVDDDYGLATFAENNNTKSEYLFPIMTIDNRFVGIVGIDFVRENTHLNSNQILEIAQDVSSIGGTLVNVINKTK